MANELARREDVIGSLADLMGVAKVLAKSGFFQDASGDTDAAIAKAATKVLAGRELGFSPFASMNGIYLIQGKPTVSANLMATAIRKSGRYDYKLLKLDETGCIVQMLRKAGAGWEVLGESRFTAEDAKKANTKNRDTFPRNMYFARAISNAVRWYAPDVFEGSTVYTPEEMGAEVDGNGNVVEGEYRTVTGEIHDTPAEQPAGANGDGQSAPAVWQTWKDAHSAIAWAANLMGVPHEEAEISYIAVKNTVQPQKASDMFAAWFKWVREMKERQHAEQTEVDFGMGDDAPPPTMHVEQPALVQGGAKAGGAAYQ